MRKNEGKYYLVAENALPEVLLKVIEAKTLLETGEADTVGAAAEAVSLSRSSFYKYRDCVSLFWDGGGRIVTFDVTLRDTPGILSATLTKFAECGANILTINQGVPSSGRARVTISADISGLMGSITDLLADVSSVKGLLKIDTMTGHGLI